MGACSINPPIAISEYSALRNDAVSLAVPFYPQTENHCGPAALATVISAAGSDVTPDQLSPQVYLPQREGSLQIELIAATRTFNLIPFVLPPEVPALLAEVETGRPVLLLQNLGTRSVPLWHYSVLIGYDKQRNSVQVHSGEQQGLWLPAPEFLRSWDWGGRWAMLALPPGQLPVAVADRAVSPTMRAIADFEAVAGAKAATPAWLSAAERWPDEPAPKLALGNYAYQQGRHEEALSWYRRGLLSSPGNPGLTNNLASLLGKLGCPRVGEAIMAPLAQKLEAGSPWAPVIKSTLEELAARPGKDAASCRELVHLR